MMFKPVIPVPHEVEAGNCEARLGEINERCLKIKMQNTSFLFSLWRQLTFSLLKVYFFLNKHYYYFDYKKKY
jgi:hypothetical protein